jgi:prolyl oligopeptidase
MKMYKKTITLMLAGSLMMMNRVDAQLQYPVTKKVDQTDDYFGTKVMDTYRWLEDDKSAETKEWVTAENAVTQSYLAKIPYRKNFREAIEKVFNYPKYSAPFRKGEWFYFYKNDGLQNQSVLYRQKGLGGKVDEVLDPNKLSPDGTTRLQLFSLSKEGNYAVVGLSKGGSDWQTYYVRDMNTGKDLPDELNWVKISGAAWKGDGFYYSRYPSPEKGTSDLSAKNENHQVYYHKVGTIQSEDILVY